MENTLVVSFMFTLNQNRMKTAVEWLVEVLILNPITKEHFEHNEKCLEQAKEMEKEQTIKAHNIGRNDKHNDFDREGEQYYNETFKSE